MKKQSPKISYDKENKIMSIELIKVRSVDSDIQDNVVIDYDKKGNISRINFYDFSFNDFKSDLKAIKNFVRHSESSLVIQ